MNKRKAFTLAEVLIALAIIGVVAAMTIPTFMANTAGRQFRTAYKKTLATMTQAVSANKATEGYDFATAYAVYGQDNGDGNITPISTAYDPYNGSYMPVEDGLEIIGSDTPTVNNNINTGLAYYTDIGAKPSLFHIFQNNLKLKNSAELQNYAVAGTPTDMSCAGRLEYERGAYVNGGSSNIIHSVSTGSGGALGRGTSWGDGYTVMDSGRIRFICDPVTVSAGGINQGRMFQMEDGAVFTYDPAQGYCTESRPCYGYIDVNGPVGPNRMIACSAINNIQNPQTGIQAANEDVWIPTYSIPKDDGWKELIQDILMAQCTVETKDITDIYPVLFYNSTIKPATLAAKAVLENTKSNQHY